MAGYQTLTEHSLWAQYRGDLRYSSSKHDLNLVREDVTERDRRDMKWQKTKIELPKVCVKLEYFHYLLAELKIYFNQTCDCRK